MVNSKGQSTASLTGRVGFQRVRRSYLVNVGALFAVYLSTGKLGLMMDPVSGFATFVWPPTGISLAALLIFGYRLWPGIALGAFLVNLLTGASPLTACGMAVGNTLEALLGAFLLRRLAGFSNSLERLQDVTGIVILAALLSTIVSATIGVSSLWLGGVISLSSYSSTWIAWWLGDMLSDLVIAPLLLVWGARPQIRMQPGRVAEAGVLALSLVIISLAVFDDPVNIDLRNASTAYMVFPILIWAALRFGPPGAVTATFAVSVLAIRGALEGSGPFTRGTLAESLLFLQIFTGVVAVTSLFLGAVVAERERAQREIRDLNEGLEQRVIARTAQLEVIKEELEDEIVERKKQEETLEKKAKELSALHAFASAVGRSLDLDVVLTDALEKLLEVLRFKAGRIFILDERKGELYLRACQGVSGPLAEVKPYRIGEGIIGRVAETGETMIFDDIQTSPEFRRLARRGAALKRGFRALACFPIKVREKILGLVNLFDDRLHRFTSDEITLIASMANQIGVAIENAKLFDEVERKVAELEAVVGINRDVVSVLDRDILLPRISDQARRIFKVDRASFRLVDKDWSVRVGWVGEREPSGGSQRLPLRETVTDKLIREDRPIIIKNVREEPVIIPAHREMMIKDGYCSFLAVPLRLMGRIVGSLNLYSTVEREFTPEEVNGIGAFADQAALAIQNADLFGELKKKAAELEKANRVKDEFLSVMSHELRTPLNVVMGYTGMILDKVLGEINQPQEKALEKVLRQSNDLLGLINSIMVATKIAADEVKVESHEVRLGDVLEEIRSLYERPMDKEVKLIWDYSAELPPVVMDREKIGHILHNLIHNAVKFTEKGTVTISTRLRQQAISNRHESSILTPSASRLTPPYVEFKVTDTGIGIQKDVLPMIFEMFRLGDSSETRPHGGVGLGLYIVRKFTEMLGGTVEVESEPGKGSTFTVTVPCQSNGAGVMRT